MEYAYIAINGEGVVCAAAVDDPKYKDHTTLTVGSWVMDGLAVERIPVDIAQKMLGKKRWPSDGRAEVIEES